MRSIRSFWALSALLVAAGCSGEAPKLPRTSHGGVIVPLPDHRGYAEILNEKRVKSGTATMTNIVAYFVQPDESTPLSPAPSEVAVKLSLPRGEKTIALTRDSGTANGVRFASDEGPYDLSGQGGEILITLEGAKHTTPFRGPR